MSDGTQELSQQQRLALSYKIFTDRDFRERLLSDPTAAAAGIGIHLPSAEQAELLKHKEELRAYGGAIDTLVGLGKDVRKLWQNPHLGVMGVNGIASSGDWDPNYDPDQT